MTFAEARAELEAAIAGAGLGVSGPAGQAPPAAIVYGEGAELGAIGRGQVPASWRILFYAGAWDGAGTAAILDDATDALLAALRALAGWRIGDLSRDFTVSIAGGRMLGREVVAARMIDID